MNGRHDRASNGRRAGSKHALAAIVAIASCVGSALAQDDPRDKAAAEALFDEGRDLIGQGQFEAACRRFEQSQAIDPGVGTLLYLGDCYERVGRLASAWAMFREAGSAARAAGQTERTQVAYERAQRLTPNLSKLALMVAAENHVDGFELMINDKRLVPALFGVPFPVDAGRYQLIARAPGRLTWTAQVEVQAGNDQRVVQVPALALAPAAATPLPATPLPASTPGASPAGAAGGDSGMNVGPSPGSAAAPLGSDAGSGVELSPRQTAALIVAGGGALAIGMGVGFGVNAQSKDDEAKAGCPSTCLTREAAALNEDARTSALIANISYGVGIAALATGAVLFFTGAEPSPETSLKVSTELGSERRMLTLSGAF